MDAWLARIMAARIMLVLLVALVTLVLATPALQAIFMCLRAHILLDNFAAPWGLVLWQVAVVDARLARPMATRVVLVLLEARVSLVPATLGVLAILLRSRAPLAFGGPVASDPEARVGVAPLEKLDLVTRQAMLPSAADLLAEAHLQKSEAHKNEAEAE